MRSECFFATPQMFCSNIPQQPSKVWCLQRHWCAEKCHTADAAFQCTVCLWKLQIASLLDSSIILGSCIFFSFSLSFPLLPFATLQSDSHAWIRFLKFPLPNIKEALQIDFCLLCDTCHHRKRNYSESFSKWQHMRPSAESYVQKKIISENKLQIPVLLFRMMWRTVKYIARHQQVLQFCSTFH